MQLTQDVLRRFSGVNAEGSSALDALAADRVENVDRYRSQDVRALTHKSVSVKAYSRFTWTGDQDATNFLSEEVTSLNCVRLPQNRWVNLRNFAVQNLQFQLAQAVAGQTRINFDFYIALIQCNQLPFSQLQTDNALTGWELYERGMVVESELSSGIPAFPFDQVTLIPAELQQTPGPSSVGAIPTVRSFESLACGNLGARLRFQLLNPLGNYQTDGFWRMLASMGGANLIQILAINQSNGSYIGLEPWVYGQGDYLLFMPFLQVGGGSVEPGVLGVVNGIYANRILCDMYF